MSTKRFEIHLPTFGKDPLTELLVTNAMRGHCPGLAHMITVKEVGGYEPPTVIKEGSLSEWQAALESLKKSFYEHLDKNLPKPSDKFGQAVFSGIDCFAHDVGVALMNEWLKEWETKSHTQALKDGDYGDGAKQ